MTDKDREKAADDLLRSLQEACDQEDKFARIYSALASARREALEEAVKWLETHAYASFSEAPHHRVVPWPDEPPDVVRRTLVAGLRTLIEKD